MEIALPRWSSILILWRRNSAERGWPLLALSSVPMRLMKILASGPHGPNVSNPRGQDEYDGARLLYFSTLRASAEAAAAPAWEIVAGR